MDKILEMLGADKLEEAQQTEIKEKLETIIESKATEIAEGKITEEVSKKEESLKEEYTKKVDEYKEDITSKFSNFVDSIIEEELSIPEKVMEYARLGELYHDLVEQFKVRLSVDEGLLNDEVKDLLKEAKDEIVNLKSELNEATKKSLDLQKDAQEMAAHIYLREKCDGLTEAQKNHVLKILGDCTMKEEIDKKFKYVVESFNITEKKDDKKEEKETDDETQKYECPDCGAVEEVSDANDEAVKCPECGETMKAVKENKDGKEDGKGSKEVPKEEKDGDKKEDLKEETDKTPWDNQVDSWIRQLNG